jgi:hypothetical protein
MIDGIYAMNSPKIQNIITNVQTAARTRASAERARAARANHELRRQQLSDEQRAKLINWRARLEQELPGKADIEPSILEEHAADDDVTCTASDSLMRKYRYELMSLWAVDDDKRQGIR